MPAGEVEQIPLTSVRKTIARRLTAAWQVPVFQLTVSADMTRANELVERARELNPDVRITVTDLLAKICAQALMRHPEVNVQFTDEALLRLPDGEHRHRGRGAAGARRAGRPVGRAALAGRDRGAAPR